MRRSGVSLIEVIVVIGILAFLFGLVLPAVQRVRETATRTRELNKLRQFGLAVQNFADAHQGQLPNTEGRPPSQGDTVLSALAPYMEFGDPLLRYGTTRWRPQQVKSEADPSFQASGLGVPLTAYHNGMFGDKNEQTGDASYAFNALAFKPGATFAANVPDGTAQTIGITHHYARCARTAFEWFMTNPTCYAPTSSGGSEQVPCWTRNRVVQHASTFADAEMGDATPPGGSPRGPLPTPTFQTRPKLADCDFRVPQALFSNGLMVSLLDGSVRTISTSVTPETFWGLVSPAGGEILGDW